MPDVHQHAVDVHEQFSEHADLDLDEIEGRLDTLANEYRVPIDEARRSVVSHYLDETGLERETVQSEADEVELASIDTDEQWIDVTAKVVELWEPRSESISQVGLLGDESGTTKFVSFATSELPELDEGAVYRLSNLVTDEYEGSFSVKLNRTTTIEEVDADFEVGDNAIEAEGVLVDVQNGSGLIKRCPEEGCTRVLQNGRCSEHGEVDGEFDLRIKAVLDDGTAIQEVIFDREATEELGGIDLEQAKEMAMDALDTTVVADEISTTILGRYYQVSGPTLGRYLLVNEQTELRGPTTDPESLLIKARSM